LKKKTSITKNCNIYTPNSNEFLKLKNMDRFIVSAFIYMHFCVCILFGIYYVDLIYDMLKQKEDMCKKIARKNLTQKNYGLFDWPKTL